MKKLLAIFLAILPLLTFGQSSYNSIRTNQIDSRSANYLDLLKPIKIGSYYLRANTDSVWFEKPWGTFISRIDTNRVISSGGGSGSMVYPGAGIALSTGSAWGTSITNNSSGWNTASTWVSTNGANAVTAFGWGNHASAGYLTLYPNYAAAPSNRFYIENKLATKGGFKVNFNNNDSIVFGSTSRWYHNGETPFIFNATNSNISIAGSGMNGQITPYFIQFYDVTYTSTYGSENMSLVIGNQRNIQTAGNILLEGLEDTVEITSSGVFFKNGINNVTYNKDGAITNSAGDTLNNGSGVGTSNPMTFKSILDSITTVNTIASPWKLNFSKLRNTYPQPYTISGNTILLPDTAKAIDQAIGTFTVLAGTGSLTFGAPFKPANGVAVDTCLNESGHMYTYLTSCVGYGNYRRFIYSLLLDELAPGALVQLSAPSVTGVSLNTTSLRFSWPNITNNVGYTYRISTDNGSTWGTPADLTTNTTQFDITGLTTGTRRDVQVLTKANGTTYSNSAYSATANATTSALTTLSTPTNFTATAASTSQINLSWTDIANESSYEVYRSTDQSTWTQVGGTIAANSTSYNATGLSASTQYFFRLRGFGDLVTYNHSSYATANATTQATNTAPSFTSVTLSGTTQIGQTLTATANGYSDADSDPAGTHTYRWQRSDNGSTGWADISGATSTTHVCVSADSLKYLRCGATPVAATGTSPGTEVFSSASGQVVAAASFDINNVSKIAWYKDARVSSNLEIQETTRIYKWLDDVGTNDLVAFNTTSARAYYSATEGLKTQKEACLRAVFSSNVPIWVFVKMKKGAEGTPTNNDVVLCSYEYTAPSQFVYGTSTSTLQMGTYAPTLVSMLKNLGTNTNFHSMGCLFGTSSVQSRFLSEATSEQNASWNCTNFGGLVVGGYYNNTGKGAADMIEIILCPNTITSEEITGIMNYLNSL